MKTKCLAIFLISQLIGNVINLDMTQQSNDEHDYENETAMKIDETMVNLRQSTIEPDAELIMISSRRSDDEIKRRKRQAEENPPNEVPEENVNENEPPPSESFTPATEEETEEDPAVNLEVETSITKGPTTTFMGGFPLSVITRQPNTTVYTTAPTMTTSTTSTTSTTATTLLVRAPTSPAAVPPSRKVTYYTKKPLIFPSETTTKFTVGVLVRQQSTGLTFASHKAKMAAPVTKNMKLVSTTKKVDAKIVQKKVEGMKKVTKLTTRTTMKGKVTTRMTNKMTTRITTRMTTRMAAKMTAKTTDKAVTTTKLK